MGSTKEYNARETKITRRHTRAVGLMWIAALSVFLWCVIELTIQPAVSWSQSAPGTAQDSAPTVGVSAIGFNLKTLDGTSVGLERFRGKPLIMNFFARWCDPCRDEMPLINELAIKSSKDGYSVLGIAVQDGRAAVAEYAREAKLVFSIALDLDSSVKRAYRIFGPPATFFIDAQGVIRDLIIGPMTPERAREGLKKVGVVR